MIKLPFYLLLLPLFLFACNRQTDQLQLPPTPTQSTPQEQSLTDTIRLELNTKYGPIVLKLFGQQAPQTVKNFLAKVQSGFYNNLTFHRVVPNFVVQGGDPNGTGSGGGQIDSELNQLPFGRGSLGLARGQDPSISNDSQFFICLTQEQCQHLTGSYVNFGQVESGMDVVDQIQVGDLILSMSVLSK